MQNKLKFFFLSAVLFLSVITEGQNLYVRTFGSSDAKPIIFLHGGPGFNCANFESTTAKRLSENGFFVIVYDRRGEGRSIDTNAKFTFKETFNDLDEIYKKYKISKASLIGHSFGGIVAILFAEKHPEKINSVFLVGAPVSLQEIFRTILRSTKEIYKTKNDTASLRDISYLEKMDTTTAEYFSSCFGHAMKNRFYSTKNPGEEMKNIYKAFWKDTLIKHSFKMTEEAPAGFLKNENYTSIDLTKNLITLISKKSKVYGIYGKDDGLYSNEQVTKLKKIIGNDNLKYLDNCSHNVFIDQQTLFVDAIKEWDK